VFKSITKLVAQATWWGRVQNASWHKPEGIDSNIYDRMNHPVTHVSWNDAKAYCEFFNKRLPTEAEWEFACRGGLEDRLYPWGNLETPNGQHRMNIWQGRFPEENTAEDGFLQTAPVEEFVQNNFSMKNIVGDVWEWTNDFWTIHHSSSKQIDPVNEEVLI
jgi:sulfatase modifying factor 1